MSKDKSVPVIAGTRVLRAADRQASARPLFAPGASHRRLGRAEPIL